MIAQKNRKMPLEILVTLAIGWSGCGGGTPQSLATHPLVPAAKQVVEVEDLFRDAGATTLTELASSDEDETLVRQRSVTFDVAIFRRAVQFAQDVLLSSGHAPALLQMNFFSDTRLAVEIESVEMPEFENLVLTGRIAGDAESAVTLVLRDGILVGDVRRSSVNETFEIRHVADGIHMIRLTQAKNEGDCNEVDDNLTLQEEAFSEDEAGDGIDDIQTSPVIDILVAYTPQARVYQGGTSAMKALIQLGIADTNQALANSGSSLQVRLAGTLETRQNETGAWRSDLYSLKGKTDGRWDEVHAERVRLGADQVTVVGRYAGSKVTGIAFINASVSRAFAVVKSSAFKQYTFSHELGHNLGLRHEDGYVNSAGRFRTIIAYGSFPRIRRYSNPDRTYNGFKTGTSSHNEIRVINRNAQLRPQFNRTSHWIYSVSHAN